MKAPFPWFGGKSRAAHLTWAALGDVPNYVEPFAGSLAVLLSRPHAPGIETVNDADGFVANAWRAIAADPEAVVRWADWPVNENDLHARHSWLVVRRGELTARLEGDPDYYDAKIAGWWLWGIACWIGSGWCSGVGPWQVVDGKLVNIGDTGQGVKRRLVHLGDAGEGVKRQLVHLGNGQGVKRQLVHLGDAGEGVHRKRVHLGDAGHGDALCDYMHALCDRMARVRVCCGDWSRVTGPAPTTKLGLTGVLLDPPYSNDERCAGIYALDDGSVAADCRRWAIEHGDEPLMRIVLCGYAGEHAMPDDWTAVPWKANGGYASKGGRGRENAAREVLWCSPHCLSVETQERLPV